MNLEEHLASRTAGTVTRNACKCCRRALLPDEHPEVCCDCCGMSGLVKHWGDHWSGWDNSRREGLSTPIGELPELSIDSRQLPAAEHPPPQSWFDETGNPFVPQTSLGARLSAIRQRMLAAGQTTITWDELDRELGRARSDERIDALAELTRKT